ncbi:hypothetical protein VNO77_19503 [Canavalia gladiata]|uniref:Uncharacterized protein n=1 Tax=Canavalia gladiata TaxID=3824 RepID=A0AAN9QKI4_CANGL
MPNFTYHRHEGITNRDEAYGFVRCNRGRDKPIWTGCAAKLPNANMITVARSDKPASKSSSNSLFLCLTPNTFGFRILTTTINNYTADFGRDSREDLQKEILVLDPSR